MPISDKLVNYAVNHDDIGILAPKVIGPNGLPQEINTGLPLTLANKYKYLLKETPLSFLFKEFIEENNAIKYKFDRPLGLFSVSGCCFMITKKSLDFIFPLDEDFFLYMEEQIIGIKLTKYSLKAVILPNCHVIHMHGKTTSKVAAFSFSCLIQSEILYFRKYHNSSLLYLFPLLLLRICQFIYRSLFSSDYRKGVFILLSKIYNALRIKYA
jgi:GT2 family glycosyltransferase